MPGLSGAGFNGDVARKNIDIVECVKCGHQMREADKEPAITFAKMSK